jgi:DNA polymerase I-like protein with 3'-5' exonuclease and polymerase domains
VQIFDGETVYYTTKQQFVDHFLSKPPGSHHFIMMNAPFDMDVLSLDIHKWEGWVENECLWDIQILYKLWKLATIGIVPFRSSLAIITKELLGVDLDKDETVRCTFGEYIGQPLTTIPEAHLIYGADDAIATFFNFQLLMAKVKSTGSTTNLSHAIQLAGKYSLNRIYKNGIWFDIQEASNHLNTVRSKMSVCADVLATYGWVRGQKGIKEKYESIIVDFLGLTLPRNEDGSLSSKEEDLEPHRSHHFIDAYLTYIGLEKQTTFIRDIVGYHGGSL